MSSIIDLAKHRAKAANGQGLVELATAYQEVVGALETSAGLALMAVIGPSDREFDRAKADRLRRLLAHLKPCVVELANIAGLGESPDGG